MGQGNFGYYLSNHLEIFIKNTIHSRNQCFSKLIYTWIKSYWIQVFNFVLIICLMAICLILIGQFKFNGINEINGKSASVSKKAIFVHSTLYKGHP